MPKMQFFPPLLNENIAEVYSGKVAAAAEELHAPNGRLSGHVGWLNPLQASTAATIAAVLAAAAEIKQNCDVFVVLGVGGSYLGAKCAIEALRSQLYNLKTKSTPNIYFAGNDLHGSSVPDILELCHGKEVCINAISKSGSTLETSVAFGLFEQYLRTRYGEEEYARRIYCTTESDSDFYRYAHEKGYNLFEIPRDIGGRYSALTPVGLLPMAVAGIDIHQVLAGAAQAALTCRTADLAQNDCYRYTVYRHECFKAGRGVELFAFYDKNFSAFGDWLAQLFGESEGKAGRGIFPTRAIFSTDLHSLGQFIQEGAPLLFETTVFANTPATALHTDNLSELILSGALNRAAMEGTLKAHGAGGVPNALLELAEHNEYNFGFILYFFMKAAAMSALLFEVHPFDQPGVEAYKQNIKEGIKNLTGNNKTPGEF